MECGLEKVLKSLPESVKGTYVLQLELHSEAFINVGRLGKYRFLPGYYYYVGSAHGPGGLRARIRHHLQISSRPHWHLDYIRPLCKISRAWYRTGARKYEHAWAGKIGGINGVYPSVTGFGSSDCHCISHLFHVTDKLNPDVLDKLLGASNTRIA